ncbi:MAG: hypothetical protein ACREVV_03780 [Steroidobacteraceae bacterium]
MFRALLICTVASACAVACTSTPSSPDARAASASNTVPITCIRDSGSRIPANPQGCQDVAGRSYSHEDIDRTGQTDVGNALRMLDPSVTVHH